MAKSVLPLIFLLLICLPTEGAERYAGEFLNLGVGARPLGMGACFVAIADDATATYWNPAGLGLLNRTEIAFMHAGIFGLDKHNFINYAQPLGKIGTFGLSWIRLGIDDITITKLPRPGAMSALNRPFISGYMQDTENAFMFSYGRRVKIEYRSIGTEVQIGGSAKLIYNFLSGVKRNAIGFGGDIGIIWRAREPGFSLGMTLQDIFGTKILWNTTYSPTHTDVIPPNLRIGVAYSWQIPSITSRILFSIDADTRYGWQDRYGIEYVFSELLSLRAGIREHNLTAGAGINASFAKGKSALSFLIDYAFLSHELGNSHRISLITRF
ncbi:MAG: PorV/PorQ family protein [Halobacteria archaeon]